MSSAGIRNRPSVGATPEGQIKAGVDRANAAIMMEMSSAALSYDLSLHASTHPCLSQTYDEIGTGNIRDVDDEETFSEIEMLDTPDWEENIEYGEGAEPYQNQHYTLAAEEDFWQYAWRKWSEDFDSSDDKTVAADIARVLGKLEENNFSVRNLPQDLLKKFDKFRSWFDELREICPLPEVELSSSTSREADIIFSREGTEIKFEVNLGLIDRLWFNGSKKSDIIILGGRKIPIWSLSYIRELRRRNLFLLARYLLEKQADFFTADSSESAFYFIKPDMQKHFAEHLQKLNEGEKNKDTSKASWASRVIHNKSIQPPFVGENIPASLFFDKIIPVMNVLTTALEITVFEQQKTWIAAPVQRIILGSLGIAQIENRMVANYNTKLKKIYPAAFQSKQRSNKSVDDTELTSLINEVGKRLKYLDKEMTELEVGIIRKNLG